MNLKNSFHWFLDRIRNYNVFTPEENDYNDDDEEINDPVIARQQQIYSTRLYVLLLIVCAYVLFYSTLVKSEPQTVVISNINSHKFEQLYLEHGDRLSCPCSTITIPYNTFISNTITYHPVCSSIFISQQWIEALYLPNASRYGVADFRSTAKSQFHLLSSLCSFSQNAVSQNRDDLNDKDFISIYLLPEVQVQSEVDVTFQFLKNSLSTQMIAFLNYLRIVTDANYFISALNTNAIMRGTWFSYKQQWNFYGDWIVYDRREYNSNFEGKNLRCNQASPIDSAGFFSISTDNNYAGHLHWHKHTSNDTLVAGFFAACTPLEALLSSTLDCLYNISCLQLLNEYFPALNQMNLNITDYALPTYKRNISVLDHLNDLFIDQLTVKINYSKYFDTCNPSKCIYSATDKIKFSYALALFISLYGGLIIILRLIAPFLVKILLKFKFRLTNQNTYDQYNLRKFVCWMKRLNLFKTADDRREETIKQQKIVSRIYLVLLIGSFLTIVFVNSFSTQLVINTVQSPSLAAYNNLQMLHSNTLRCPCSTVTISHRIFISLSPTLHEVCSSDLVSDRWISILKRCITQTAATDWRNRAYQQFQLLSDLCQFANKTINNAIDRFFSNYFVSSNVLNETDFNTQINSILMQLFTSTAAYFDQLVDIINSLLEIDQPFAGILVEETISFTPNIIQDISISSTNSIEVNFVFNSVQNIYSKLVKCICPTDSQCQSPTAIFNVDFTEFLFTNKNSSVSYVIPGAITGCSTINSLLLSSLECFYSGSNCSSILMSDIKRIYTWYVEDPTWFDFEPFTYDSMSTHFLPNTSILSIVKDMMIEQWNPSVSYKYFYESCAPSYCSYTETGHGKAIIEVILALISMIGGLTISLRLLTPCLIKIFIFLLSNLTKRTQEQESRQGQVRLNCFARLNMIIKTVMTSVYTTATDLNIFPQRNFGTDVNRITAKRFGQLATRLYLVLFFTGIIVFTIYSVTQSQLLTKTFNKPSLEFYNYLRQDYGDELKCSCSSIASPYSRFTTIVPIFHEICSSPFASDEWRINLTANLVSNLSIYNKRDYRRFLSAHLQYLTKLCYRSMKSVNKSIEQFLTSLFVTNELVSEIHFYERLSPLIEQSKSNAPKTFVNDLSLIRNINHGNALISSYRTNFEYIHVWTETDHNYLPTQPIIYDNNCSCGLYSNCTTQATFINSNSSKSIPIDGMKMGCTPSESFLSSTLECFYDYSCLNFIQQYTNYTQSIIPLSTTINQFAINTTVAELLNHLFMDHWSTTMNYSLYFQQCSPSLCSYTYIQQFNLLYIVTLLLGFQGGLTIVLKWLCPLIIRFIFKTYQYRTSRRNINVHVSSTDIINITNHDRRTDLQSVSEQVTVQTNANSSVRCTFKKILQCVLLMFLIIALIVFSIYIARQDNIQVIQTSSSIGTTTDMDINSTTVSILPTTTGMLFCQLQFEAKSLNMPHSGLYPVAPATADFNNDGQLDVVFFSKADNSIFMLLGNGNGTFRASIRLKLTYTSYLTKITVADFNFDNKLDIAFTDFRATSVGVLFGNGNGTFGRLNRYFTGTFSYPRGIVIDHFNHDDYLDIAFSDAMYDKIIIYFGDGNGNFPTQTTLSTGKETNTYSITATDLNGDNHSDIIAVNYRDRNIGVFLGYGNGTFDEQKTFFTGGAIYPKYITFGDLNNDAKQDIAFSYTSKKIGIMYGYGNGSFSERIKFDTEPTQTWSSVIINDFNNDGHLDIVYGQISPYGVGLLLRDPKGNFEVQTIFSTELQGDDITEIAIGDFNRDGYQDLIAVDSTSGSMDLLLNTGKCHTTGSLETSTSTY